MRRRNELRIIPTLRKACARRGRYETVEMERWGLRGSREDRKIPDNLGRHSTQRAEKEEKSSSRRKWLPQHRAGILGWPFFLLFSVVPLFLHQFSPVRDHGRCGCGRHGVVWPSKARGDRARPTLSSGPVFVALGKPPPPTFCHPSWYAALRRWHEAQHPQLFPIPQE